MARTSICFIFADFFQNPFPNFIIKLQTDLAYSNMIWVIFIPLFSYMKYTTAYCIWKIQQKNLYGCLFVFLSKWILIVNCDSSRSSLVLLKTKDTPLDVFYSVWTKFKSFSTLYIPYLLLLTFIFNHTKSFSWLNEKKEHYKYINENSIKV